MKSIPPVHVWSHWLTDIKRSSAEGWDLPQKHEEMSNAEVKSWTFRLTHDLMSDGADLGSDRCCSSSVMIPGLCFCCVGKRITAEMDAFLLLLEFVFTFKPKHQQLYTGVPRAGGWTHGMAQMFVLCCILTSNQMFRVSNLSVLGGGKEWKQEFFR